MRFSQAIFALALAASNSAQPIDENSSHLLERDGIYICKPKENDSIIKVFTITEARAKAQAGAGAFMTGKSGDPHKYGNGDGIKWGVKGCDRTGKDKYQLWECKLPLYTILPICME